MIDGDFDRPLADAARGDEIGKLATTFASMRDQLGARVTELEARIASRAREISATQDISRVGATQRDVQPSSPASSI